MHQREITERLQEHVSTIRYHVEGLLKARREAIKLLHAEKNAMNRDTLLDHIENDIGNSTIKGLADTGEDLFMTIHYIADNAIDVDAELRAELEVLEEADRAMGDPNP